jgi:hypothetical protein
MTEQSKAGKDHKPGKASVAPDAPMTVRRDTTPTIFADGLLGGSIESGVIRLELLARHLDSDSKSISPALVGRLVMPAANFATFVAALLDLAKKTGAAKE